MYFIKHVFKKNFLRSTLSEEFQEDYLTDLEGQLEEEERKEMELIEKKYQQESPEENE